MSYLLLENGYQLELESGSGALLLESGIVGPLRPGPQMSILLTADSFGGPHTSQVLTTDAFGGRHTSVALTTDAFGGPHTTQVL